MAQIHAALPPRRARSWLDRLQAQATFSAWLRKSSIAVILLCGDFISAVVASSVCELLIRSSELAVQTKSPLMPLLLILVFFGFGLYRTAGPSPCERLRLRVLGLVSFFIVNVLLELASSVSYGFVLIELTYVSLLLIIGYYTEWLTRTILIYLGVWGRPTALVGFDSNIQKLATLLARQPEIGLRPVGFIKTTDERETINAQAFLPQIGIVSDPKHIRIPIEAAIFNSASELARAESNWHAWMPTCQLLLLADGDGLQSLWVRTRMLGPSVAIEIRHDRFLSRNRFLKRIFDIVIAIPLALLTLPLLVLLALVIKVVDPGPAFFVQERVGFNGSVVNVLKLRTMYADAEQRLEKHLVAHPHLRAEWERFFKLTNDPRVLPAVGHFIRRASLDELPQLWNVIWGDMSLVGPRPFPSYHMSSFDAEFQSLRVSVQPGITGMWQISSRSDGDLQAQKAQDLFYLRNWSLWLDLYILLQTLPAVLSSRGAR